MSHSLLLRFLKVFFLISQHTFTSWLGLNPQINLASREHSKLKLVSNNIPTASLLIRERFYEAKLIGIRTSYLVSIRKYDPKKAYVI